MNGLFGLDRSEEEEIPLPPFPKVIQAHPKEEPAVPEDKQPTKAEWDEKQAMIDDLQSEVGKLRQSLRIKEQDYSYLKELYKKKQNMEAEYEAYSIRYRQEHEELVALRSFVYRMTETEEAKSSADMTIQIEELSKKNVIIIGGHDNWVKKLRQIFPGWSYLSPGHNSTISRKVVLGMDFAYFFTDTISHMAYYRFIDILREYKVPFGYIHRTNVEMVIRQLYQELMKS